MSPSQRDMEIAANAIVNYSRLSPALKDAADALFNYIDDPMTHSTLWEILFPLHAKDGKLGADVNDL